MATTGQGTSQFLLVSMAGGRLSGSIETPSHLLVSHQPREGAGGQIVLGAGKLGGQFVVKSEPVDPSSINPHPPAPVQLYLCDSTMEGEREENEMGREKTSSIDLLQQSYHSLTSKKIKNTLSSFLPDIPGEFDAVETADSTLRTLIDRPPIGGREFLPLSEQMLLGFRLHPGALPEQYRLDPSSADSHHHHKKKKKRKHRHKHIDREDSSLENYSPPASRPQSPPIDPCSFIKAEQTTSFFQSRTDPPPPPPPQQYPPTILHPTSLPHGVMTYATPHLIAAGSINTPSVIVDRHPVMPVSSDFVLSMPGVSTSALDQQRIVNIEKKRNKKRHQDNGEGGSKKKKKKDKDKKRKKEKHHSQDPLPQSLMTGPPPLISSSSSPFVPRPPHNPL